jgi:tRNA1(Val) A37 N6-methylase TrmN6
MANSDSAKWIAIIISVAVAFAGTAVGAIGLVRAQQYEALQQQVNVNSLDIKKLQITGAETNVRLEGMQQTLSRIEESLKEHMK